MKPQRIDKTGKADRSIDVQHHQLKHYFKLWHYHPELELVVQLKSTGTRFVGDNISKFEPGEVVLIGPNLPHMWLNDKEYFEKDSKLETESYVIHFKEIFAGSDFLNMVEMKSIKSLLTRARQGIKFNGEGRKKVFDRVKELIHKEDFEQTISFIQILKLLADEYQYEFISTRGFVDHFKQFENEKLDIVYDHVINHFKEELRVEHVAEIVHMNPSSFSRYFSRVHGKAFSRYVNEVRIGYACRLLLEENYNIMRVCLESGFNNLSNFNRQFKLITGYSPTVYVKKHDFKNVNTEKVSLP